MENSRSLALGLLSPVIPSSQAVMEYLRANPAELSKDELGALLDEWTRWPFSHKEAPWQMSPLVMHLIDTGADPWGREELVDHWVKRDRVDWVRKAFSLVDEDRWPSLMAQHWLHEAVERSSPMASMFLSMGARQLRRSKDGATPLHLASDPSLVAELCSNGANIAAKDHQGIMPMEAWLDPFKETVYAKDLFLHARRIVAMFREALKSDRAQSPGLQCAPLALAACGAWMDASIAGRMTMDGFEVVPIPSLSLGASPLTGWAFSVFQGKGEIKTLAGGKALLDRCFIEREGTWDHEWILAAAAFQHLQSDRRCASAARSSFASDAMRHAIATRLGELSSQPALTGDGTRLSAALRHVATHMHNFDWSGRLNQAAGHALVRALVGSPACAVPGLDAKEIDGFLNVLTRHGSGWMTVNNVIQYCWEKGVPDAFWERMEDCDGTWLEVAVQKPLAAYARRLIELDKPFPPGLKPQSSWPEDLLSIIQSGELASSTNHAASRRPMRRI